ncbi:MAG: molybdopterin-synthase adenylyltransferase MoeB [Burkholderiales bacterium]|nr:molybdopterin-synthase adenylyltransferase MoeB [Anaerolineae bacterium]
MVAPIITTLGDLSTDEIKRFSRHLILPDVGLEGQRKLKNASVLIIGTGGLGSPTALYLAAAGIGRIGLVDYDVVEISNLQRQIIHGQSTLGMSKLDSAELRIKDINPHVQVDKYNVPLFSDNALEIFAPYDVIIDGTDNFPTRYLVNDACVKLGKPNVYGSIFRFEGQLSVFWADEGPCYRCMFPSPPPPGLVPNCAEGGVLGVLPGTIGMLQATEAIKLLLGIGDPMIGRMLLYDALEVSFTNIRIRKNPNCPVCSIPHEQVELIDYEQFCGMPAHDHSEFGKLADVAAGVTGGSNGNGANGHGKGEITVVELKQRWDAGEDLLVLDVRNANEFDISALDDTLRISKPDIEAARDALLAGRKPREATVLAQIPDDREIIVMCRSGKRSADVIEALRGLGYENPMLNLTGGILAWAKEIDPEMATY